MPEVQVRRTLLPSPTIDDPERKVYQIEYRVGELPPRFLVIPEKEWSPEKEKEMIRADMRQRIQPPGEIITIPEE